MATEAPVLILGIETSCDETAASVVQDGWQVRSSIVASQHELHREYAGVVPEIASRAHLERILPVIRRAMTGAEVSWSDLDAIAVGHRPGLIGSLLVGVSAAKALAWSLGRPIIGVDHVLAHLWAARLDAEPLRFPALGLVVSGGHTALMRLESPLMATIIGRTIDDAVGEAYDKAATILGLPYPGGPKVDQLAASGDESAHDLPVSRLDRESLDFSFSGLKTALLYAVRGQPTRRTDGTLVYERDERDLTDEARADFCASFQRAAARAVLIKVERALDGQPDVESIIVGGGVSANSRLRHELTQLASSRGLAVRLPELRYCVDNAAMIAGLAAERLREGLTDDWRLAAQPASALI